MIPFKMSTLSAGAAIVMAAMLAASGARAQTVAPPYFRNRLRISCWRIVVGAVNDDQVERRDHKEKVRARTPRRLNTRKRDFGKVHTAVVDPPEIFVSAKIHPIGRNHFAGMTAFYQIALNLDC